MKKILIVNPFGIGDVIFSTPLVEILRKNFPDSYIGYLCNRRVSELMVANPCINKIFVYEKDDYRDIWKSSKIECVKKIISFLRAIKKEKFNISVDLSLTYQYSMLLKLIGVKKRIGFNYRDRGIFLTDKIDMKGFENKHVIEHYLDTLKPLGIDVKKYSAAPRIYASEENLNWAERFLKDNGISKDSFLIGLIPGCGASWGADARYRRWDKKNFAALAGRLIERYNAKIVLLGNEKETQLCEDVEALIRGEVINACGRTSVGEFLGILSKCSMVITNDGGPLHMAVGLNIRTVSIFGPVDEKVYGPYPPGDRHIVISKKNVSCRPCYKKFKYSKCDNRLCLDSITADEVFKAVEKMVNPVRKDGVR